MRFAVEQIRQRPLAQRACSKIGDAPLGITDAAWPAARVAGASLGEAPARIAHARAEGIRTKWLRYLDSAFEMQAGAGWIRRIRDYFQHRRGFQ